MKKTYYATAAGHINGAYREFGDEAGAMTEKQAKYLLMSGTISPTKPDTNAAPALAEQPAVQPAPEIPSDPAPQEEPDPATLGRKNR